MPLQNRVDPRGLLHAVEARGAWMGNRGVLHDDVKRIVAAWRSRRWITCVLEFRGRRREVFSPRRYTELFFLDEATSLAAGHRPCAECRRSRYEEFRAAWAAGRGHDPRSGPPKADEIDRVLHAERVGRDGEKKTWRARLASPPPGVLVGHEGRSWLCGRGTLAPWSFGGYGPAAEVSPATEVEVLTPGSIVGAIASGFVPQVHESADW